MAEYHVRSFACGGAVVAALSAIETSFLKTTAPGVGAYEADHAPLMVAEQFGNGG